MRDLTMRLTMDPLRGCLVRRMHQAKGGAAPFIKPVSHVLDPVPALDVDIPAVRFSDIRLRQPAQVVAVHEDGQGVSFVRAP